ncbi:hypothetical protein AB3480_30830 [Rhizobium mongolense]|uniref:hypothetical protein n=1 Tax=Rhizobium mongolense TaxID=57676 RepID=UPI0034A219CC
MISIPLRQALLALAPNRSRHSWVAGSVVMAQFLSRIPNDIDIHHLNSGAFEKAVGRDTESLLAHGFRIKSRHPEDAELEVMFAHPDGAVFGVNWVLERNLPRRMIDDAFIGVRASITDVVQRKIEMYIEDKNPKHKSDLTEIFANTNSVLFDFEIYTIQNKLRELSIFENSKNISSSGF